MILRTDVSIAAGALIATSESVNMALSSLLDICVVVDDFKGLPLLLLGGSAVLGELGVMGLGLFFGLSLPRVGLIKVDSSSV